MDAQSSDLPVFDLSPILGIDDGAQAADVPADVRALCEGVADCLHKTGCLVVRVPGVNERMNDAFLDQMEAYFGQPLEARMADVRPDVAYQVGATPSGVETPRCLVDPACAERMAQLPEGHRATPITGPDVKWRFFWRVGPRPEADGRWAELNADPVAFPGWASVMDGWGGAMLGAVRAAARAAAVGFGLEAGALTRLMEGGPHLLAPTGSDLTEHGAPGTVLAGYHYDLNLLTIHGRSRFPGLFVWLRDGRRAPVSIPPGCLLLQAGRQLEWLTGGHVRAGWHEVVVSEATRAAAAAAAAAGRSLWRVSSTLFAHAASAAELRPLGPFAGAAGAAEEYPPVAAGEQVRRELEAIKLRAAAPARTALEAGPAAAGPQAAALGHGASAGGAPQAGPSAGLGAAESAAAAPVAAAAAVAAPPSPARGPARAAAVSGGPAAPGPSSSPVRTQQQVAVM